MTRINEALGQAVRELLDGRGLSLRQARIRTGVDIDTLGRMRAGDVPRVDKIIDFARGFELDINDWLELAGYPRVESRPDPTYEHLLRHTVQAYGGGPIPPEDLEVLEAILRDRAAARERKGR